MRTNKNTQAQYQTWDYCRICYNVMNIQTGESTEEYRDEKKIACNDDHRKKQTTKNAGIVVFNACVCVSVDVRPNIP